MASALPKVIPPAATVLALIETAFQTCVQFR